MEVIAKCDFLHDQLGTVREGRKLEVNERQLKQLKALDLIIMPVQLYETKVTTDHPSSATGAAQLSSASPVAQASPQTIAPESKRGRGRPRKSGE